jgi:hypothetical protein
MRVRCSRIAGAALLAVAAMLPRPIPVAAVSLWTITAAPAVMLANKDTTVELTITNLGLLLDAGIGCVEVSIPGVFELKEVKLVSLPSGKHWKTGQSGGSGSSRVAEYRAEQDDDVLSGGETAVFKVKVKAASAGAFTWTARAWSSRSCDGGSFVSMPLAIVVGPNSTPAPTAAPTPTPTPQPTPTSAPTPTPSPKPSPTLPPLPSLFPTRPPTATPRPDVSPTPSPTPAPAPTPGPSDRPAPSDRPGDPSASPTATPSPWSGSATPTPSDDPATNALPPVTADGSGPGDAGPGSRLRIGRDPEGGGVTGQEIDMSFAAMESLGNLSWAVPSLVLAVPGLLLVLAVLAQAVGGALWLPVIRRRIGSFGVGSRRRA